MTTYKIGTRGSLLAVTQSTLMKRELERISGEKFELVTIKTQGDEITNKPLWQLEGKDFFTKELDEALLRGDVDLVIHSYKDLGSIRPAGIKLASITERKFAHDILLIPDEYTKNFSQWKGELVVGTSSPRRMTNLTRSLKNFLPKVESSDFSIRCETLRGNVNSRIKKLRDGKYHAIVLALAGLERLTQTLESAAELKELLNGLNFLVLPQSVFPSAASQGALGIELREDRDDDGKLYKIISQLAHETTVEEVFRERKAFKEYGGGCHLAVGIHVRKIGENFLHVHSGEVDGKRIESKWLEGIEKKKIAAGKKFFVGLPEGSRQDVVYDRFLSKVADPVKINLDQRQVFVTSRYCLPALKASLHTSTAYLWAAGTKSAELLTHNGFWLNGTADSLGSEELEALKNSSTLLMMAPSLKDDWVVLSHGEATSELGQVVGVYQRVEQSVDGAYEEELKKVGACYWTSFPQYETFLRRFPFLRNVDHYCGLGKTWQEFKKKNITVIPVTSLQDFYELKD